MLLRAKRVRWAFGPLMVLLACSSASGPGSAVDGPCGAPKVCDVNAACNVVNGAAACACREGYTGNGKACALDVVPAGVGWSRIAGTHFTPVCATAAEFFGFQSDCRAIFTAWSGGVADTARNRLLIAGGGHNDYYGNEIYAFDLGARRYARLNDPTRLENHNACGTTLPDGRPTSRHTYAGLTSRGSPCCSPTTDSSSRTIPPRRRRPCA